MAMGVTNNEEIQTGNCYGNRLLGYFYRMQSHTICNLDFLFMQHVVSRTPCKLRLVWLSNFLSLCRIPYVRRSYYEVHCIRLNPWAFLALNHRFLQTFSKIVVDYGCPVDGNISGESGRGDLVMVKRLRENACHCL
jgi:hypothetical protein